MKIPDRYRRSLSILSSGYSDGISLCRILGFNDRDILGPIGLAIVVSAESIELDIRHDRAICPRFHDPDFAGGCNR
jgi:hypothetical protein